MLSPTGTMGRLPFLLQLTAVNAAAFALWLVTLFFHPKGSGHIVVLGLFALLHWMWFSLHARRLADGGKPRVIAALAAGGLYAALAASYLVIVGLNATPEVQQEYFRTGGSMDTAVETSALVKALGGWMVGWAGAAFGAVITGAMVMGQMLLGAASGVFSLLCLVPGARGQASLPLSRKAWKKQLKLSFDR